MSEGEPQRHKDHKEEIKILCVLCVFVVLPWRHYGDSLAGSALRYKGTT
jgi:hypothetical protein